MYDIPFDKTIQNVVTLQVHTSADVDTEKEKKLVFLTRQLELLSQKQFSMNDYCFALQSYPKCNYEQLRDFLVLPCCSTSLHLLTRTSGMAQNNRDCKATSILCVMMKSLHKGPSLMISDTCPQADRGQKSSDYTLCAETSSSIHSSVKEAALCC
ncbi:hypothetical protein FHG87_021477 [Trinorchestia longiramus]|nr:hypothetical protein FHG87_021477 [Trinorchestia longiramus]